MPLTFKVYSPPSSGCLADDLDGRRSLIVSDFGLGRVLSLCRTPLHFAFHESFLFFFAPPGGAHVTNGVLAISRSLLSRRVLMCVCVFSDTVRLGDAG